MTKKLKLNEKLQWKPIWYLIGLILLLLGSWPKAVAAIYSPYIFKPISYLLRFLFGSIGFSMGEWVYLFLIIYLIISILKWVSYNKVHFLNKVFWKHQFVQWLNGFIKIYIVFELIWGLNYQKLDPSKDFKLEVPNAYTENQMDSLCINLAQDLNLTRTKISDFDLKNLNFGTILTQNSAEFDQISKKYPFLTYTIPSVKKSFFPSWGDYFGYLAFYQPITGEAIIRGDLPTITLPFTMSHEIAHQLGYASEEQANFIAYVIGVESNNPIFNYASQLELFNYAQYAHLKFIAKRGDKALYNATIQRNKQILNPKVIEDRKMIRNFFLKKQHLQISGTSELYDQFLKWNKQSKGIDSYEDVLLWVLAYKNKKNP
jgi:hypothetical protein